MKHLKSIYEYRKQLVIPFDGTHPLHDKAPHQHLIDVLHELDTRENPKNYTSSASIDKLWDDNYNQAKQIYLNFLDDYPYQVVNKFLNLFPLSRFPEYYQSQWHKEYKKDINKFEREAQYEIKKFITDEGKVALDNTLDEHFSDALDEHDAKWNMKKTQDENGLIPIYRAIQFYKSDFRDDNKDEFENAIKHGGVGYYWSWELQSAEPYGGYGGKTLILYGKIKPEHINWGMTIFKSGYDLSYEREVQVEPNKNILIYAIGEYRRNNPKKMLIEPPIIVPA